MRANYVAKRGEYLARAKAHYSANREAKLAYQRGYARAHAENVRVYKARYRVEQRAKLRAAYDAWYADPVVRARIAENRKAWKRANPDRVYDSNARRRARLRGAGAERFSIATFLQRWDGVCGICRTAVDGDFHIDHVIPLSKGGAHEPGNLQVTHAVCNLRKGASAA